MSKSDPVLGAKVHQHLLQRGVETPMIDSKISVSEKSKIAKIEKNVRSIMETLGLDLADDSLIETPMRVAKMYVNEICNGLDYSKFPKCTVVDNKMKYDEMVVERCTIKSLCEHHLVYFGTAHNPDKLGCFVAYMPKDKVLGLSKINRIVDFFSRRPQIQERLTEQIAETLKFILETDNVAVMVRSQHFCVLTRGVEDADSFCITSYVDGEFRTDPHLKAEFMQIVNR
jgi:GTP cyclohydrolase IA